MRNQRSERCRVARNVGAGLAIAYARAGRSGNEDVQPACLHQVQQLQRRARRPLLLVI